MPPRCFIDAILAQVKDFFFSLELLASDPGRPCLMLLTFHIIDITDITSLMLSHIIGVGASC